MTILRLEISQLRNLQSVSLSPHQRINLLTGANGSGKTSILEAIFLLGMGRSFRSGKARRLVNDAASSCTVFATLSHGTNAGIKRGANGETELRINGNSQVLLSEMAQQLPLALLEPDSFSLLDEGSKPRRAQLDWGLFHVEQGFYPVWQRYHRALKQRNSLLRSGNIAPPEMRPWERELAESADQLHQLRLRYIEDWQPFWSRLAQRFLPDFELELEYSPGWNTDLDFVSLLEESRLKDLERGHTQIGPHRADLKVKLRGVPAEEVLSRGQKKLAISALKLSQVELLESRKKGCILLVDDLPSELDQAARSKLLGYLARCSAQVFITGIEPAGILDALDADKDLFKLFHVEHGAVGELKSR